MTCKSKDEINIIRVNYELHEEVSAISPLSSVSRTVPRTYLEFNTYFLKNWKNRALRNVYVIIGLCFYFGKSKTAPSPKFYGKNLSKVVRVKGFIKSAA